MNRVDPAFVARPIAHRGLHGKSKFIYENSRSAFAQAIARSLPIECDLQCTKDGKAVVFHDPTLERLTDRQEATTDLTAQDICSIKLGKSEDRIQTLPEFLAQVSGQVPLLIEVKDQSNELGPKLGSFMDDIVETLSAYQGVFALMSFNPYQIAYLREKMPDACLGLVTDNFLSDDWPLLPRDRAKRLTEINEVLNLEIDFISHFHTDLARIAHLQIPKFCWTVKSHEAEIEARKIADNITFEQYMPEFK